MTKPDPEQLDRLLQQWAERRVPRDMEFERLRERIDKSLEEDSEPAADRHPGKSRRLAAVWMTMGAAAVLLTAIGLSWLLQPENGEGKSTADHPVRPSPPSYVRLPESHLREKAILLREMESIFERQVAWLLEAGDDVNIGVVQRPTSSESKPVTVRVVVERRKEGQGDWETAWAADVVARSEEVVQIGSDSADGTELVMWSYVLPDGMIEIDAELTLGMSPGVRMTTNSLQRAGEPVEVHSGNAGGYEFRLFQTAAVLDEPVT